MSSDFFASKRIHKVVKAKKKKGNKGDECRWSVDSNYHPSCIPLKSDNQFWNSNFFFEKPKSF